MLDGSHRSGCTGCRRAIALLVLWLLLLHVRALIAGAQAATDHVRCFRRRRCCCCCCCCCCGLPVKCLQHMPGRWLCPTAAVQCCCALLTCVLLQMFLLPLTREMPAADARSLAVHSGSCAMLMWRGASCFSSAATSSLSVPSPPPAMIVSYLEATRTARCCWGRFLASLTAMPSMQESCRTQHCNTLQKQRYSRKDAHQRSTPLHGICSSLTVGPPVAAGHHVQSAQHLQSPKSLAQQPAQGANETRRPGSRQKHTCRKVLAGTGRGWHIWCAKRMQHSYATEDDR
jgi:hypothetical protein